jgi:hypothetical protein
LVTSTIDTWLPDLIDNFFTSNPFFARMLAKNNVKLDGGYFVRQNLIYQGVGGGSHATGTPYDTSLKQFMTYMLFPWRELYAPLAMDETEEARNEGAAAVVDYAMSLEKVAELTLFDTFGTQLYAAVPGAIDLQSLITCIPGYNSGASYGGLTADTSPQGLAIAPNSGNVNTTGGPFSWDLMQALYGAATYGSEEPDLIITTQALYNKMLLRAIPAQRWRSEDLKKIFGAEGLGYNRADIMVDQHCPTGYVFMLNTKYWKLVLNRNRAFIRRSSLYSLERFPVYNDSMWVDQIVAQCQLVDTAPRLSAYESSIT